MTCLDENLLYLSKGLAGLDVFVVQNPYRKGFSIICSKNFDVLASLTYELLADTNTISLLDTLITDLTLRSCFEL